MACSLAHLSLPGISIRHTNSCRHSVFYLKFFEHPSFGRVAHEIYPFEWKVHSSEISITIMYLLIHVFDGCSNRFDPCDHFNLVCCCLSPVLISDKRSCWKISQSLKPIWLYVEMLVSLLNEKNSISAAEMPVKFQSNWKIRRGLAKKCDRTSYVILNQPQDLFSVQQTEVW